MARLVQVDDIAQDMRDMDLSHSEDSSTIVHTNPDMAGRDDEAPGAGTPRQPHSVQRNSGYLPLTVTGWEVRLPGYTNARLHATAVTKGGRVIIGVGSESSIWVWQRKG